MPPLGQRMPRRSEESRAAEAAFRARLEQLGATLLEPGWLGNKKPHRVRCSAGHACHPRPEGVRRGQGICITCANMDPAACEATFRAQLAELGATPLYGEYGGANHPHHVRCAAGHDCYPRPNFARKGHGICITCAGRDPRVAEAAFRKRLAELGAVPMYATWLGANRPHHIRCAAGHDCHPKPAHVRDGRGICRTCSGRDPVAAEAAFRATLGELGATPLYGEWRGTNAPHHIRCQQGHDSFPAPAHIREGKGICRVCARRDPATAEAEFRERLAKVGAVPLYEKWLGALQPHRVRCAAGHDCYPRPASISQGMGPCRTCKGQRWDVFYVVTSPHEVKFGITSGDPAGRLRVHARDGFTSVIRTVETLPDEIAPDAERAVKAALALAGERPIRGKEYFDISCLALILDVADSWLVPLAA